MPILAQQQLRYEPPIEEMIDDHVKRVFSESARRFYKHLVDGINDSMYGSAFLQQETVMQKLKEELGRVRSLSANWDSFDAPAPSEHAAGVAEEVLERLYDSRLLPERVVPSAEGGVALYFSSGARKAYFEFSNDGETVLALYEKAGNARVCPLEQGVDDDHVQAVRDHLAKRA